MEEEESKVELSQDNNTSFQKHHETEFIRLLETLESKSTEIMQLKGTLQET